MKHYYIGADVHCNNTELAIEHKKKIISRYSVPTNIEAISEVLTTIDGRKFLALEEGPMAGWLYRNLKDKVHKVIVCDPRRNKLIASDGDKNDKIDAAKLAALLRGKFLRSVYHTDNEQRLELKRWVGIYDDRIKEATRYINRIRAQGRMYGIKIPTEIIRKAQTRLNWLETLNNRHLAKRIEILLIGYDAAKVQAKQAKEQMLQIAKDYRVIRLWQDLPGIGPIRAITLFAYLDTPYRFKKKSALWKYCGLGLSRQTSGKDKHGNNNKTKLKLEYRCNRKLKNVIVGAVRSAIGYGDNDFKKYYEELIFNGKKASNVRHSVGRKMLTIMWGMWKADSLYAVGD